MRKYILCNGFIVIRMVLQFMHAIQAWPLLRGPCADLHTSLAISGPWMYDHSVEGRSELELCVNQKRDMLEASGGFFAPCHLP